MQRGAPGETVEGECRIRTIAREEGDIVPEHSSASDKGEQQPDVRLSAHAQALQRAVQLRDGIVENEDDMEDDMEDDVEDDVEEEGNDAPVVHAEQPSLDVWHAGLSGWHSLFSQVVGEGKSGNAFLSSLVCDQCHQGEDDRQECPGGILVRDALAYVKQWAIDVWKDREGEPAQVEHGNNAFAFIFERSSAGRAGGEGCKRVLTCDGLGEYGSPS